MRLEAENVNGYRNNVHVLDWIKPSLESLDPLNKVPGWALVYRKEKDLVAEESKDMQMIQDLEYVDEVLDTLQNGGHDIKGCIDEHLRVDIKRLVLLVQTKNRQLEIKPYGKEEIACFVTELWRAEHFHGHRRRDDGKSYSRDHLYGSVENAIVRLSITDLDVLIVLIHHDDVEDLEVHAGGPRPDLLVYEEAVIDLLSKLSHEVKEIKAYVKLLRKKTASRVKGVTKLKSNKLAGEGLRDKLDIRLWLIEVMEEVIVALIKLCDKLHNAETLDGKGRKEPEKAKGTAILIAKVYAAIAEFLKLKEMRDALLQAAYEYENPDSVAKFNAQIDKRLIEHLPQSRESENSNPKSVEEAFRGSILRKKLLKLADRNDRKGYGISGIAFVPKTFGECAKPGEKIEDKNYDPFETDIDGHDSMFEVVVQTENPERVSVIVDKVIAVFKEDRIPGQVNVELEELPPVVQPQEGSLIKILDPVLGGRVWIRVIDARTQATKLRGIFASMDEHRGFTGNLKHIKKVVHDENVTWLDDRTGKNITIESRAGFVEPKDLVRVGAGFWQTHEGVPVHIKYAEAPSFGYGNFRDYHTPEALRAAIARIVRVTATPETVKSIFDEAGKELFRDSITVFTPKNEPIVLSRGSNAADFAAMVYKGTLANFSGAKRRNKKHGSAEEIAFFDTLNDQDVLDIQTSGEPQLELGWHSLVNSYTQLMLKKIAEEASPDLARKSGEELMLRICKTFNIRGKEGRNFLQDLIDYVCKELGLKISNEEFFEKVGRFEILPMELILEKFKMSSDDSLSVLITVDDKPDLLAQITHEFGKDNINIVGSYVGIIRGEEGGDGKVTVRVKIKSQDLGRVRPADILKCVFRLGYKYDTTLRSRNLLAMVQRGIASTAEAPAR